MNIREQLAVAHSRANADLILVWLYEDAARTQVLMDVVSSQEPDDAKLVQRAAMLLGDLGRQHPDWLKPYHAELIVIAERAAHPALPRNVLRCFSELPPEEVSQAIRGPLLTLAFDHLSDRSAPVATRVFSMSVVAQFTDEYPELKEELHELISREIAEGVATPGFVSRGRKILAS